LPAIGRLARYAFEVDESPPAVIRAAFAAALEPDDRSEAMPTAADVLRAEGRREALLRVLEARFGTASPENRLRIEEASDERVRAWLDRVGIVDAIEEVFTD